MKGGTRIVTVVADDHHEVVPHVLAAPGGARALLHLDAHADLLLPRALDARWPRTEDAQPVEHVGIGDWILPLAWAGRVRRVVWVQPPWAAGSEIAPGRHLVTVGRHKASGGVLRVSSSPPLPLFLDDRLHVPREQLDGDVREVELVVVALDTADVASTIDVVCAACGADDELLLDVDLDFFATFNPFRVQVEDAYGTVAWDAMRAAYGVRYAALTSNPPDVARHALLNAALRSAADVLVAEPDDPGAAARLLRPLLGPAHVDAYVAELACVARRAREMAQRGECDDGFWDGEWLDTCGCMFALPHHESTPDEVVLLMRFVEALLPRLPRALEMVTIARSTSDNYTPAALVDGLQAELLRVLERAGLQPDVRACVRSSQ